MLYLPTLFLADCKLRLPVLPSDVVSLCALFPQQPDFESTVMRLFRSSPGLVLYAAGHIRSAQTTEALTIGRLVEWVRDSMFDANLESRAFEAARLADGHLDSLMRWRAKPSRKRLAKYLAKVSEFGLERSQEFIAEWFRQPLDFDEVDENEIYPIEKEANDAKLPIRSMWMMVGKIQQMQVDFDVELASQKMAAMKQLAYGASHEINNPLANVATRAQGLMARETCPGKKQKLSVIYAQAMRAHEMISDMMLFAHPPALETETCDVVDVVETVGRELRREFKSKQIKFEIRRYPNMPVCELDSTQVAVALKAMIENSVNAIGIGGKIRVQLWAAGPDELGIAVVDDGPGIDHEIAGKLFDPFFSGREAGRGLGFGLSKAWRIAELHGGSLEMDKTLETGARMVMRLPLTQQNHQKKLSRIDNLRAA